MRCAIAPRLGVGMTEPVTVGMIIVVDAASGLVCVTTFEVVNVSITSDEAVTKPNTELVSFGVCVSMMVVDGVGWTVLLPNGSEMLSGELEGALGVETELEGEGGSLVDEAGGGWLLDDGGRLLDDGDWLPDDAGGGG